MPALSVDIPCDPSAPARARRAVETLAGELDPHVVADVKLLVSELVTNSVKYGAAGWVGLVLRSERACHLHVEVHDDGEGFVPEPRDRPATEAGGWGLHLVQTLSDRWGVAGDASRVWFEISRAAAARRPAAA